MGRPRKNQETQVPMKTKALAEYTITWKTDGDAFEKSKTVRGKEAAQEALKEIHALAKKGQRLFLKGPDVIEG